MLLVTKQNPMMTVWPIQEGMKGAGCSPWLVRCPKALLNCNLCASLYVRNSNGRSDGRKRWPSSYEPFLAIGTDWRAQAFPECPGGRVARELELERILILIDFCAVFLTLQTAKQPNIIHTAIIQHIKNTEMLSSAIFVLYRAKLKQKWCAGKVFSKWWTYCRLFT